MDNPNAGYGLAGAVSQSNSSIAAAAQQHAVDDSEQAAYERSQIAAPTTTLAAGLNFASAYAQKAMMGIDHSKPAMHQLGQFAGNLIPFNQERKSLMQAYQTGKFIKQGMGKMLDNPRQGLSGIMHDAADAYAPTGSPLNNGLHMAAQALDTSRLTPNASASEQIKNMVGNVASEGIARQITSDPDTVASIRALVHPNSSNDERTAAAADIHFKGSGGPLPADVAADAQSALSEVHAGRALYNTVTSAPPAERVGTLLAAGNLVKSYPQDSPTELTQKLGYVQGKSTTPLTAPDDGLVLMKHAYAAGKAGENLSDAESGAKMMQGMLNDPDTSPSAVAKLQALQVSGDTSTASLVGAAVGSSTGATDQGKNMLDTVSRMRKGTAVLQANADGVDDLANGGPGALNDAARSYQAMAGANPEAYASLKQDLSNNAMASARAKLSASTGSMDPATAAAGQQALTNLQKYNEMSPDDLQRSALSRLPLDPQSARIAGSMMKGQTPSVSDARHIVSEAPVSDSTRDVLDAGLDAASTGRPNRVVGAMARGVIDNVPELPDSARKLLGTGVDMYNAASSGQDAPKSKFQQFSEGFDSTSGELGGFKAKRVPNRPLNSPEPNAQSSSLRDVQETTARAAIPPSTTSGSFGSNEIIPLPTQAPFSMTHPALNAPDLASAALPPTVTQQIAPDPPPEQAAPATSAGGGEEDEDDDE